MSRQLIESEALCDCEVAISRALKGCINHEDLRAQIEQFDVNFDDVDIERLLSKIASAWVWNLHEEIDYFMGEGEDG